MKLGVNLLVFSNSFEFINLPTAVPGSTSEASGAVTRLIERKQYFLNKTVFAHTMCHMLLSKKKEINQVVWNLGTESVPAFCSFWFDIKSENCFFLLFVLRPIHQDQVSQWNRKYLKNKMQTQNTLWWKSTRPTTNFLTEGFNVL